MNHIVANPRPDASERPSMGLRVWLADLTYTQQTIAADVIPNAIGGIATFTETCFAFAEPMRLFKFPEALAKALDDGPAPDVIGFSNYVWNSDLSYQFALLIKKHLPKTVVVFGGPNYPVDAAEQEAFLRARPAIDFYIVKEGELAFSRLVGGLVEHRGDVETVKALAMPSVHAIGRDGKFRASSTIERIRDLATIPSPYLSGRLDEFFNGQLLPIIQTNRGCPFSCTFCVEGVLYYNKVYKNPREKIDAELDYIGQKMRESRERGGRNDLFIADSNFGMYADDLDTCRALAGTRQRHGWPEYINVATGKNQKERVLEASRIIDGALRLSGSVQSLDPEVLEKIKRKNISADGLMDLALRANEVGANTYSEIILGLPGDSRAKHYRTVRTVMDAGFTNLYLFQLMLLPGSELGSIESKVGNGMTTRYRALPRCYGHYHVFGEDLIAAEIEEICVASNTLSFEDYLDCRMLHLVVTIFYNDTVFGTLPKLLRMLGVSVFSWMEELKSSQPQAGLRQVFDSFSAATCDELWNDHDALTRFIREPGTVDKYIAGELGNNLLFVHKSWAIVACVAELVELARSSIRSCLRQAGKFDDTISAFVDDCLTYHHGRLSNLFAERELEGESVLRFDIPAFEAAAKPTDLEEFRLSGPSRYRFSLDDEQKALIERYIGIYGSSRVGIGRVLSKVYVRKILRHPIAVSPVSAGSGAASQHAPSSL